MFNRDIMHIQMVGDGRSDPMFFEMVKASVGIRPGADYLVQRSPVQIPLGCQSSTADIARFPAQPIPERRTAANVLLPECKRDTATVDLFAHTLAAVQEAQRERFCEG